MAKARILKKKTSKKAKFNKIVAVLFTLSIFAFIGARFGLRSYNYGLSNNANEIETQVIDLKDEVAGLKYEVNNLQSRDRVLSMAKEQGIQTNQDNVIVMEDDKKN